jgi:putative oxidoreductase
MENQLPENQRIATALLLLRLGVFIVMIIWTLDKFVNPQHSAAVFENFYGLSGFTDTAFMFIGLLQLLLVLAFVAGFMKRISYGIVLLLHGASTLSSWQLYLDAFNNLLFFAAWPMLAACIALYMLRDLDTRFTVDDRHR